MAQNYTGWPTFTDVITLLGTAAIPIRSGVADAFYTAEIDGVVSELERKTHRQFIPDSVDTTRYYDGSGYGNMVVDDMISLTSVTITGWAGLSSYLVTSAVLQDNNTFPKNRIIIAKGIPYQFVYGTLTAFPAGRENIIVVGKFGYNTYIPDEVWLAVRNKAASRVATSFINSATTGRTLQSWVEGDSAEKYIDKMPGESLGWDASFDKIVREFKIPTSRRINVPKRQMV